MAEGIAPLIFEIRAKAGEVATELGRVRSEVRQTASETEGGTSRASAAFHGMAGAGKALAIGVAGVAATVGTAAVKMGMDFQESMTSLVTGAGESEKNIGMVSDGILAMAGKVGLSSDQLAKGMYLIESAGFHGAAGLKVLQAAAEGARVGNADMKTVADGVTTALSDYGLKASDAARVTSELVKTVASGKTNMGDLAASLATVLPVASTAKIGLDQVLGAMATMTAKGTPAADAATYLKQTIAQLSNPTTKAAGEMKSLGLSAIDISQNLGKRGLTGTMDVLTQAIAQHMGPQGTVLIDTLKKGASSAGGLQSAISKLPPAQQTYVAALADMVGGTKSMQAALMLTGASAGTFKANVKGIGEATTEAGGHVEGFAETQKDLKTKLENAKSGVLAMVTALGMKLIPVVTKVLSVATTWGNWLMAHKPVLIAVAAVIGGVLVAAIGVWIASMLAATVTIGGFTMAAGPLILIVGGIIAAVVALGVGIYELVTHWTQVWGAIKSVAATVWNWIKGVFIDGFQTAIHGLEAAWSAAWGGIKTAVNAVWGFLKTVFNWVKTILIDAVMGYLHLYVALWVAVFHGIEAVVSGVWGFLKGVWSWIAGVFGGAAHAVLSGLGTVFSRVWGAIKAVVSGAWSGIKTVWGWITGGVGTIKGAISDLGGVFSRVWDGIKGAVQGAWKIIKGIFDAITGAVSKVTGAIGGVVHGIGSIAGKVGHFLGFANGGIVPGPIGVPRLAVVHGGEYVLSNDMLAGRQEPTDLANSATNANGYTAASPSQQALAGTPAVGAGRTQIVNVTAQTNADPRRIASEVGWQLRAMA